MPTSTSIVLEKLLKGQGDYKSIDPQARQTRQTTTNGVLWAWHNKWSRSGVARVFVGKS